ncbi:MAG TPA: 4-(cytidine 5'-diphospho)-2-C-methyl-D-erythritol kinase [Pseudolabrys sp.]|nr:4-(cytidine 5'-diphospho)-2-C-methyl-D-erythritol kinase [Pseudolabrys sp.]
MTASLTEHAPAKINLTLRIVGRRADGYHELESLVGFAGIADTLSLVPDTETTLDIGGPYAAVCGPGADNLVLKAVDALHARIPELTGGRFKLEKSLPVAAGIGGGSADAAAALRLLARTNGVAPHDPRLLDAAKATGADVPVCVEPRPRVMRGVGEVLSSPVSLPRLPAILVNPRVALSTRDVFTAFAGMKSSDKPLPEIPRDAKSLLALLAAHGNDLEPAAVRCAPVVGEVLRALEALPEVKLTRMSGSGSTCFALFASADHAKAAARQLSAARPAWWVEATVIG